MDRLKSIANLIINEGKKYNVEYISCSVKEEDVQEFNVDVGEFSLLRTLYDKGVAISVYKDKKHGAVAVNGFDEAKILQAVKDAITAAESSDIDEDRQINDSGEVSSFEEGPLVPDRDKLFARTKELIETIEKDYPKLLLEQCISEHVLIKSVYANSYGNMYESKKGGYSFFVGYSGHDGEKSSHSYGSGARLLDLEKPFIDCNIIRKELSDTEKQSSPEPLNEKFTGTVVFTPGCASDVIAGTIIGNFVSDSSLIDNTSIWRDKLGEKVCDERINLRLAPNDDRIILGGNFSSEGYLNEDYDIIKDGILESFFLTQYGANKTGKKRSPNTSSALIIKPGEKTLDEIISGIDKGIYIGRFSGGRPGANGEFSGVAKNAFLIENGKITKALAETMISDNLPDMLFRLRDISKEVQESGGSSVPYMAFDGVTISGK